LGRGGKAKGTDRVHGPDLVLGEVWLDKDAQIEIELIDKGLDVREDLTSRRRRKANSLHQLQSSCLSQQLSKKISKEEGERKKEKTYSIPLFIVDLSLLDAEIREPVRDLLV
jgi:hypothetical protein